MTSTSRVLSGLTFTKIFRQTNNYQKVLNPTTVKVFVPGGFPYEAFNGKACIRPWSVTRMIESSRAAAFASLEDSNESFIDAAKLYNEYLFFIASTSTTIESELYNPSIKKGPLELEVKLDYVGNMTYKVKTTVSIQGTSSPLFVNDTQTVSVDKKTRRPVSLPDWWKEKFSVVKGESLKVPRLVVPENVKISEHPFQAQASDMDPYMHINWSTFIKYYHDAFILSEFKKNPTIEVKNLFRDVKNFSVCYIKEASLGDKLSVKFWQNSTNKNVYYFQTLKASDVICECTIEFFP